MPHPTLSALVRRILLETAGELGPTDHPLHDRAHRIAQRLEDPADLAAAASPETMIGRGNNARVYRIPGEDDLVLRVERSDSQVPRAQDAVRVPNPFGEMNVGQPLARVGNASVLLRQRGEPAGMSRRDPAFEREDRDEVYRDRIKLAGSMPQEAYDRVASDLMRLHGAGHTWDPSKSNNILVDGPGGRFGLVDTSPMSSSSTPSNTAGELISCLVGNAHAYSAKAMELDLAPARRQIVARTLDAARRVGLPISYYKEPSDDSTLMYSLALAGLTLDQVGL